MYYIAFSATDMEYVCILIFPSSTKDQLPKPYLKCTEKAQNLKLVSFSAVVKTRYNEEEKGFFLRKLNYSMVKTNCEFHGVNHF